VYTIPVAAFHADQTNVNKGVAVNFHDDSTGDIASWSWDFGDGGTSTSQNPSHPYSNEGTYTVTLAVTGSGGGTSTEVKTGYITVKVPPPPPPVADFSANVTSGNEPLPVLFSDKSTGAIDSWLWDFGDGDTSTDQNPSHTYTDTGNFTVTLTVTGPGGYDSEIKTAYINVSECNVMVPQDYPTIQKAIDASEEGCTIWVSTGTYLENINFHGKALRVKGIGTSGFCNCSSDMENKVTILGLYSGSVVTFNTGEDRNSIIEGFTIKNGYAPLGGGILINNASPTIRDCYIYENHAYSESTSVHGGGIAVIGSNASPLIFNNLIFNNTAQGAVADSSGGGVYVAGGASPTIQNCTIADNISKDTGDGIYVSGDSALSIVDSIIWHNSGSDVYCATGCSMNVSYSDVGEAIPGIGNISADPFFVPGILGTSGLGNYYLSHVRAGQDKDSPCIDAGSTLALYAGLDIRNTATDGITDGGKVDMGFHYTPTLFYIENALTSPGTVFGRGQNIRYSIIYTIEGNPDTLYKVIGKITVKGAYRYSVSRSEEHYPGVYTMHFDSTVPSTALLRSAVVTYKATLKQVGKKDKLAIDTRTSEISIQ
jgi:PKD repeat protein